MISLDLTDIDNSLLRAKLDEGVELLGIEFYGPRSQVTRTAGMQVDPDPLSEIVGLINFKVG
jgi:hypothetical protein